MARKKAKALKQAGVAALAKIGASEASAALTEASKAGDRTLRRLAHAALSNVGT